jgi:chromatin assembly factor 1 subunit B
MTGVNFTLTNRSVSIFSYSIPKTGVINVKHLSKHFKIPLSLIKDQVSDVSGTPLAVKKSTRIYHDESLLSFFRRPWFSPDGNLFLTPTGQIPKLENPDPGQISKEEEMDNCVLMYSRGSILK